MLPSSKEEQSRAAREAEQNESHRVLCSRTASLAVHIFKIAKDAKRIFSLCVSLRLCGSSFNRGGREAFFCALGGSIFKTGKSAKHVSFCFSSHLGGWSQKHSTPTVHRDFTTTWLIGSYHSPMRHSDGVKIAKIPHPSRRFAQGTL